MIPAILFVEMWGLWDDQPHAVPQHWAMHQDGMGLRDWFAGQALAGSGRT